MLSSSPKGDQYGYCKNTSRAVRVVSTCWWSTISLSCSWIIYHGSLLMLFQAARLLKRWSPQERSQLSTQLHIRRGHISLSSVFSWWMKVLEKRSENENLFATTTSLSTLHVATDFLGLQDVAQANAANLFECLESKMAWPMTSL